MKKFLFIMLLYNFSLLMPAAASSSGVVAMSDTAIQEKLTNYLRLGLNIGFKEEVTHRIVKENCVQEEIIYKETPDFSIDSGNAYNDEINNFIRSLSQEQLMKNLQSIITKSSSMNMFTIVDPNGEKTLVLNLKEHQ